MILASSLYLCTIPTASVTDASNYWDSRSSPCD